MHYIHILCQELHQYVGMRKSVISALSYPISYRTGESGSLSKHKVQVSESGWKFRRTSNSNWKNQENHKQFFDWLFNQLGYKEMDDWYNVTTRDIHKHGGIGLLNSYYSGSPSKALQSVYP